MKFNPHTYQKKAIDYIIQNDMAALILDMGLGKTVITLTALEKLIKAGKIHKVLVVAPLRVARTTWSDEIEKWEHLKGIRYSVCVGTEKERKAALSKEADIYIINRENVKWLISSFPWDFDTVVIDELSGFKNYNSVRHHAMMKVRSKIDRIYGLTGTPTSNGLLDLFGQYLLLDSGKRLGRFITQYRNAYFVPTLYIHGKPVNFAPIANAEEDIFEKISDITISMKADDYLDMPELITTEFKVKLSDKEMEKYRSLEDDMVLDLGEKDISAGSAGVLANKLCQMANGAIYDDEKSCIQIHDRKLDALMDIIESMNGKPVLIAYWFKHDLERIKERLSDNKIIFDEIKTDESIRAWNEGKIPVALIHPQAAGHGLNLQKGGNTLVWFGLTWSLESYQQTNARLYRQGQESGSVVITHIIAEGTIDERIMKALKKKDCTQSALIEAVKAEVGKNGRL